MVNFKKTYKKLFNAYDKKLKNVHKTNLVSLNNNLDYFVTYLQFMRDCFVLTEPHISADGKENFKITSIATAISEYEQYQACISNIECLTQTNNKDNEASLNKYKIEKQYHWNCF